MWAELAVVLGAPIARVVSGWLPTAIADEDITTFEWKQLAMAIFSVGIPALAIYFGFQSAGIDLGILGGVAAGLLFDKVLGAVKDLSKFKK